MTKIRVWAILLLIIGVGIGYFGYYSETVSPNNSFYKPFKLGLDLKGGSELTYLADTSKLAPGSVSDAMSSLREVIERRVNSVGLTEAVIQTEQSGLGANPEHRLIVEIPGVMDVNQAVQLINKTPTLEFKAERPDGPEKEAIVKAIKDTQELLKNSKNASTTLANINPLALEDPNFVPTGLTGQYLKRATLQLNQASQATLGPSIGVEFNTDGAQKFDDITKNNVGKKIGIFLDGQLISAPVVREEIKNGQAQISGEFSLDEAKSLVRDLNLGALPVPIKLASTETVGATLGREALNKGMYATLMGFLVIAIFMILWYRLPGVVSVISLAIYLSIMVALFKVIPITLTAGGIAGLILSIGIAVDANVLIFERMKEELRRGKTIKGAMEDGFARAWTSIRDSNISTIISACILFWFGTAMIKGFSLNLIIGVLISMFTAVTLSRTFLLAISPASNKFNRFLFASGLSVGKAENEKAKSIN